MNWIYYCSFDGLKTYGDQRNGHRQQKSKQQNINANVNSVRKTIQPLTSGIICQRPRQNISDKDQYNVLLRKQFHNLKYTCSQNFTYSDFFYTPLGRKRR